MRFALDWKCAEYGAVFECVSECVVCALSMSFSRRFECLSGVARCRSCDKPNMRFPRLLIKFTQPKGHANTVRTL